MKHIQKLTVAAVALTAAVVAQASIPTIDDDSISVTKRSSSLVIGYELKGESAVVTVDFLTNGVSIGEANFANVDGDVNRLVAAGSRQITWKFRESWPDHKTDDFSVKLTAWPVNDPPDYLVVSYDTEQKTGVARYYVSTNALPYGGLANRLYATNNVVFRRFHAAGREYTMRCESLLSKLGNLRDDFRRVRLTRDYYMAVYETTAGHYKTLCGEASQQAQKTIYYGGDVDEYPVQGYNSHSAIRWNDETYGWPNGGHFGNPNATPPWIKKVRDRFAFAFDLPTEAEWEFACRAGSDRMYYYSDWLPNNAQQSDINVWCWNVTNSKDGPHPVGLQPPNSWGLYDIHGNVAEICLDFFDNTDGWIDRMSVSDGADNSDAHTDPVGVARPTTPIVGDLKPETTRVKRGGDYSVVYGRQSCGSRDYSYGGYTGVSPGMRLVCPAVAVK